MEPTPDMNIEATPAVETPAEKPKRRPRRASPTSDGSRRGSRSSEDVSPPKTAEEGVQEAEEPAQVRPPTPMAVVVEPVAPEPAPEAALVVPPVVMEKAPEPVIAETTQDAPAEKESSSTPAEEASSPGEEEESTPVEPLREVLPPMDDAALPDAASSVSQEEIAEAQPQDPPMAETEIAGVDTAVEAPPAAKPKAKAKARGGARGRGRSNKRTASPPPDVPESKRPKRQSSRGLAALIAQEEDLAG